MFWAFAFVCEEFCIPAISVFCKRNNISDDVAGAIFIGAGLSSPTMFASFVAIFVDNSSIGVGTVIGGDILNHLVNLAAGIYSSPRGELVLNKVVLIREVFFYLLSLILLILTIEKDILGSITGIFDQEVWNRCLSVEWWGATVLVIAFVIYGIVEAYFESFKSWWIMYRAGAAIFDEGVVLRDDKGSNKNSVNEQDAAGSDDIEDSQYKQPMNDMSISLEAVENEPKRRASHEYRLCAINSPHESPAADIDTAASAASPEDSVLNTHDVDFSICDIYAKDDGVADHFRASEEKARRHSDRHKQNIEKSLSSALDLEAAMNSGNNNSTEINEAVENFVLDALSDEESSIELFILKRSEFYARNGCGYYAGQSRIWQRRFATFDTNGMHYRMDPLDPSTGPHIRFVNLFDIRRFYVTSEKLGEIVIELNSSKLVIFRLQDALHLNRVLRFLRRFSDRMTNLSVSERKNLSDFAL